MLNMTREEAVEVIGKNLDLYVCANRTCEVGMEHATNAPYESFVYAARGADSCAIASSVTW